MRDEGHCKLRKRTKDAMEFIMGHAPPRATSNEVYGQRNPLGEQINDVRFDGLDLSGIKRWEHKAKAT